MKTKEYEYEDIREFFMRRSFLSGRVIGDDVYELLKARKPTGWKPLRVTYLEGFMDGWIASRD
jgi:hypothetical protein